ncbi:MAG TPA: hypothetical protein VE262_12800 [Blastocatellia bacterium]|nr:hypothetical protein [Blastocatellia bacterium]
MDTASLSGSILKTATMRTNDPARRGIVFSLSASVQDAPPGQMRAGKWIGPLFIGPSNKWLTTMAAGGKTATAFTVTSEKDPVRILGVEGGGQNFVAKVETVEAGKRYRVSVETLGMERPDTYSARLWIMTDHPALESFPVDLMVMAKPRQ